MKENKVVLEGRSAASGTSSGSAHVISDPFSNDVDSTENQVLVAPYFTPVSLPEFIDAAGIVTDHGGMTSHAAVLARELGIPCVTATEDATEMISEGQLVEVDGDNGTVTVELQDT